MRWLFEQLRRLWHWLRGYPSAFRVVHVKDVPEKCKGGVLYLVGENGHQWFAVFVCPCGCGEVIQLSLLPDSRPRWSVELHADETASLHPSVWRVKGCRSHFFLRRGLVSWVRESNVEM